MLSDMRLLTLKTVLVATDLSDSSLAALKTARTLTDAADASLHVVHVPVPETEGDLRETLRKAGISAHDGNVHVLSGAPADSIGTLAARIDADVIVLGPHRERDGKSSGRMLGSTAVALQRNVSVPCLVAARPLKLPLNRVLVAVSLSEAARGTLTVALSWASALRAHRATSDHTTSLTALSVQGTSSAEQSAQSRALDEEVRRVRKLAGEWAGIGIESVIVESSDVATGIIGYAKERHADLLVLGARGLSPEDTERLGSVSATVTKQLDLPALLVPPGVWKRVAAEPVPPAAERR